MSAHGRNHWIKLYCEMNHDPKIGLLPDDLKWRFTSVLLLAGEIGADGFLPELNSMAWQLHIAPDTLSEQLQTLAVSGLVDLRQHPDGYERWFVSKFSERQAPSSNAERQQQWRNRNAPPNVTVTKRYADVTPEYRIQNTETETETEGEIARAREAAGNVRLPDTAPPAEAIDRNGHARRIPEKEPEPALTANAPPIAQMLVRLTSYWPGTDVLPALVERFGDTPDETALARAVELWRLSGHKITNWLGLADWYEEIRRDPAWEPSQRFKRRANESQKTGPVLAKPLTEIAPGTY